MAHLHYGKNRTKLVRFKERKRLLFENTNLAQFFAMMLAFYKGLFTCCYFKELLTNAKSDSHVNKP
jgi:hypothetical protein